jgi:hypothetical protein
MFIILTGSSHENFVGKKSINFTHNILALLLEQTCTELAVARAVYKCFLL